MASTMTTF